MRPGRTFTAAAAAAAFVALALPGPSAFAKAPAELQTIAELRQRGEQEEAAIRRAREEALKDPRKEAIEAYASRKTPLADFDGLVKMVMDADDAAVQPYRMQAAKALVDRFGIEMAERADEARKVRLDVALAVVDLLESSPKDVVGIEIAELIFFTWYRAKMFEFKPAWIKTGKLYDRRKVRGKMEEWLKKSRKDEK